MYLKISSQSWRTSKPGYIDGLMQERHNSIANALELCLSSTNPSILGILLCWLHQFSIFKTNMLSNMENRSIPWLLMPWLFALPRHQQSWWWPIFHSSVNQDRTMLNIERLQTSDLRLTWISTRSPLQYKDCFSRYRDFDYKHKGWVSDWV